jgi:hypothetical protein
MGLSSDLRIVSFARVQLRPRTSHKFRHAKSRFSPALEATSFAIRNPRVSPAAELTTFAAVRAPRLLFPIR